jgi:hypothetical protein
VRYVSYSGRLGEGVVFGGSRGCAVLDDAKWTLRIGIGMLKSAASAGRDGSYFPRRSCCRPWRLAKRGTEEKCRAYRGAARIGE